MASVPLVGTLVLAGSCVAMMIAERLGAPVVLNLNFKGDVKRETRWLAQYGQGACTLVAAALVWRLDPRTARNHLPVFVVLLGVVFGVSVLCTVIKRLLGRVRPGRERAGQFLGPTFKHANFRESFPSSHSASAVALSVVLCGLYPQAAGVFWALAIGCAVLRYLMDAHWPSDVLGGIAIGYGISIWMMALLGA
jgi:membrane-associated phospholipid phosphatase